MLWTVQIEDESLGFFVRASNGLALDVLEGDDKLRRQRDLHAPCVHESSFPARRFDSLGTGGSWMIDSEGLFLRELPVISDGLHVPYARFPQACVIFMTPIEAHFHVQRQEVALDVSQPPAMAF